ncbi:MAG: hypothetical protein ACLU4N_01355 [Butyricimonas faecihominis]
MVLAGPVLVLFDFRFEKGDYLKCNNISLGYNLDPALCAKLYITRARLNLNMANVFTLTKFRNRPGNKGSFHLSKRSDI